MGVFSPKKKKTKENNKNVWIMQSTLIWSDNMLWALLMVPTVTFWVTKFSVGLWVIVGTNHNINNLTTWASLCRTEGIFLWVVLEREKHERKTKEFYFLFMYPLSFSIYFFIVSLVFLLCFSRVSLHQAFSYSLSIAYYRHNIQPTQYSIRWVFSYFCYYKYT